MDKMANEIVDINNKPLTMETLLTAVDAILEKSSAKIERDLRQMQEVWDKQNKEVRQQIGGMGNNNGAMAQEFFFNALYYAKTLFGQEFDEVVADSKRKIKKTGVEVQYDITLGNGKSFCIVEVKYKADTNDVKRVVNMRKPFRDNFPEHADKKLFLALASMSFDAYVENECKKNGIAIIKQIGDTIEIYDEHIKAL